MASAAVLFNTVTSTVQEVQAKRTLDRIGLLTRPKATVLRDGSSRWLLLVRWSRMMC